MNTKRTEIIFPAVISLSLNNLIDQTKSDYFNAFFTCTYTNLFIIYRRIDF